MTHTIELDATEERVLAQAAAARGVGINEYLHRAALEMAALNAQEDAEDIADARRIYAASDPPKRHTRAELRDVLQRAAATKESVQSEAERREAVAAGYGKYAGLGPTPEERRQWKDE